jgi:hypothetical protein
MLCLAENELDFYTGLPGYEAVALNRNPHPHRCQNLATRNLFSVPVTYTANSMKRSPSSETNDSSPANQKFFAF